MLAATWGGAPDGGGAPAGDLFNLPQLEPYADLAAALENSPTLTRFASERRVADAKLRLAEASATPDVNINAGVRWLEASGDHALVLGASVPLGTGSRSAGARLEAEGQSAQLASTESAARFNLMATLYALHSQAAQARLTLASLTDDLKPIAEKTLRETERGFREGRFTHLELFTAQEKLHEVDEGRIQAAVAYHDAVNEIERLTGQAVGFVTTPQSTPQER
jgi:cobalt-zinc-cadmium efflux system outer membrane protein